MSLIFTLRNLLILTAVGLAVALGFVTDWGNAFSATVAPSRAVAGKFDNASVLPDFRLQSETGTYAQISERPLLNPTRRPAPTQVVVAATEPPKPQVRRGLYQLIGVLDFGNGKIAQVREIASNRTRSVREGELLQEMTVKKVEETQVTLAFQGETDVIQLAKFTASGRVPQPAPPRPPPPVQMPAQQPPPAQPMAQGQPRAASIQQPVASGVVQAVPPVLRTYPTGAVDTPPPAQPREVLNVVEMLERRRLARQQAGGQ